MAQRTEESRFADTYKLKGMRKRLVQDLQRKGEFDMRLLQALEQVPRHFFLESAFAEQAYEDKAFAIGEGQTISQPYTVAYQTQLLNVQPGDKILEIGTGSGYQASILATLGANVFSIERIAKLSESAKEVLRQMGLTVKLFIGDGTLGLPNHAPFDKILVTAAAPTIPDTLLYQLKMGGSIVLPVGDMESQQMVRITRRGENDFYKENFEQFRFVPLIGESGWRMLG